jgi:hypothetical protein
MLMMFTLVQVARATQVTQTDVPASAPGSTASIQASAEFSPETHEVTVKAAVPASEWNATNDIGSHSLVVYEDNVRQPLKSVEVVHSPLSVGVLLEHGGRYHTLNEAIADSVSRGAQELISALNPDDQVKMWTYGKSVQPLDIPGKTATGLQYTDLHLTTAPSSESNFYDALLTVLPQVQQMPGRKALIVISSGVDTFSVSDFSEVLRAVERSAVPVCPIDIGPLLRAAVLVDDSKNLPYSELQWKKASANLARLAQVSGCRVSTPSSLLDFPAVYDGVLTNLRLQYVVRYRSTHLDLPGTRDVRVDWIDASHGPLHRVQNRLGTPHERELADTHYTLDSRVVFAGHDRANNLSFLQLPNERIQIPLRALPGWNANSDTPSAPTG